MLSARIAAVASHLPQQVLDNDTLAAVFPDWPAAKILDKTGIARRHIAAPDETAADLAYHAARKLFDSGRVQPQEIDFVLLCTQAPDYTLPTTACVLQQRLGLRTDAGALDFNLGCSGFVYGLALAKGLIETGAARKILLLTADTYSKYIHPLDKSVRTLFGDAAAATLVEAVDAPEPGLGPFVFGTDGAGAEKLIVPAGGFRRPLDASAALEATDASGNVRTPAHLYMDGPEVMTFSLQRVPKALAELLERAGWQADDVSHFVFHQANRFMLEALRKKLKLDAARVPVFIEECGNTVSSTIPLVLENLLQAGALQPGQKLVLLGFGVGYSWAAAAMRA